MTIITDSLVAAINSSNGVSNGSGHTKEKPHVVFAAAAASGHTFPMLQIAENMVNRGYEASFIGGEQFAAHIKRIGKGSVEHIEIKNELKPDMEARSKLRPGFEQVAHDLRTVFLPTIAPQTKLLREHLEKLRQTKPGRHVVIVAETLYLGHLPLRLGAKPLAKGYDTFPPIININVVPYFAASIDTGFFGPGLPPDSTPSGRARNALIASIIQEFVFKQLDEEQRQILADLSVDIEEKCKHVVDGVEQWKTTHSLWLNEYDVTLQLCSPSFEYPMSDLRPAYKFVGCLPPKPLPPNFEYPSWWRELDGKKVVAVAQGTVATNYNDLIVPTIKALGGREDVFVVATLGVRGASLPADVDIPSNIRVIDYLPYDAILERADVFVQNAGYGGVQHAITQGVPLVVWGNTEDKPEVMGRVSFSGVGYSIRSRTPPTAEQIREGVEEVLSNPSYKAKIVAMKEENVQLNCFERIDQEIMRAAA